MWCLNLCCGHIWRCSHPNDSSDTFDYKGGGRQNCVSSLWSYSIIFTIHVTARWMGDQDRYGGSKSHSSAEV